MAENGIDLALATSLVLLAAVMVIVAGAGTPGADHRARPRAAAGMAALASAVFGLCGGLAASGRPAPALLALAAAIAVAALVVWLLRAPAPDDHRDDGGARRPGAPPDPDPSSDGIDWDALERDLATHADRSARAV